MTFKSKIKLLIGLIAFGLVAIGLILYIDQSRATISSQKAELQTNAYAVGLDFSGIVVKQIVNEGDMVKAGQELFTVRSATLTESINDKNLAPGDLLYPLDKDGNITITSSRAGLVEKVYYPQGSFFPANKELATISDANSVYAVATYRLAPRDFNKITKNSKIEVSIPGDRKVSGNVRTSKVLSQSDVVVAEIEAKLDGIDASGFRTLNGTPVTARLTIHNDTYWHTIKDTLGW